MFDSDNEAGDDTEVPTGEEQDDISNNILGELQEDAVEIGDAEDEEEFQDHTSLIDGTLNSNSDDNHTGGWMADEYGWVVGPTQPTVTDSLLSTHRMFDSQETTDGSL